MIEGFGPTPTKAARAAEPSDEGRGAAWAPFSFLLREPVGAGKARRLLERLGEAACAGAEGFDAFLDEAGVSRVLAVSGWTFTVLEAWFAPARLTASFLPVGGAARIVLDLRRGVGSSSAGSASDLAALTRLLEILVPSVEASAAGAGLRPAVVPRAAKTEVEPPPEPPRKPTTFLA